MSFDSLVTSFKGRRKRSKKEVAKAILQIPREDHSNNLMILAEAIAKHEVVGNHQIIDSLARHLWEVGQLYNVRLLSPQIAGVFFAAGALHRLFRRLYISPMYTSPQATRSITGFNSVAHGCTEIVVKLKEGCGHYQHAPGAIFRASEVDVRAEGPDFSDWAHVFKHCLNLATLSIATESCRTGTLWNRTSSALTALRTAFEEAELPNITTLRMAPVDMIYVGQFKWNGPAFGRASASAERTWTRITHLELQVLPLVELEDNQRIQTFKLFNAWLRALAPRLKSLKLCYLGREGQHPFALLSGLDIKQRGQANMRMPELRELWLGRVKDVDDGRYILESLAPNLSKFHILVRNYSPDMSVAFDLNHPKELWRTAYIKNLQLLEDIGSLTSNYDTTRPRNRSIASNYDTTRPRNRSITSYPEIPVQNISPPQAPNAPPSPSTVVSQGRSSATTSRTPSSSFRALLGRTSTETGKDDTPHRSSLPTLPKPSRSRTSSAVSSLFKLKNRPKSEPTSKPAIKLVGETPLDEIPQDFLAQGLYFTTLKESIARYGVDAVSDLTKPPVLRPAEEQRIGMFQYTPGTLFQAGTGARLPDTIGSTAQGSNQDLDSASHSKAELVRKAFEDLKLKNKDQQPGVARLRTSSGQRTSEEQTHNHVPYSEKHEHTDNNWKNYSQTGQQDSGNIWDVIDPGGGMNAQGRTEMNKEARQTSIGRLHSRHASELEDLAEEDDENRFHLAFRRRLQ